jgi:hypothetical protein
MNNFHSYRQRVIAQRDLLQKLYLERNTARTFLNSINRLPENAETSQARFRFLRLEARLNEAINRAELNERRLSLIGSVTRFDNQGNNTNTPNGGTGGENNTNTPNDGTGGENNTNTSNSRTGDENNTNTFYINKKSTGGKNNIKILNTNYSKYSFNNITFIILFLWGSLVIICFLTLGLVPFSCFY